MPSLNGKSSLRLTWNSVVTLKDIYKVHVKGSVSRILTELIYGKSSIASEDGVGSLFFKQQGVVRGRGGRGLFSYLI